jgi:hypothetical protein
MVRVSERKEEARGVFWLIDDELFCFPFYNDTQGVSKSGLTYNHKRLWNELNLSKTLPYNYYPRGRVDFSNKGKPIVYMNSNIDTKYISQIKTEFGLCDEPRIFYDNSEHYKCYLDNNWKADYSK